MSHLGPKVDHPHDGIVGGEEKSVRTPLSVGVLGLGDRGLALARAFAELSCADLRWIADRSPGVALGVKRRFPTAAVGSSADELVRDDGLDVLVIATPLAERPATIRRALERGKHVMVDGPLSADAEESDALFRLAVACSRRLSAAGPQAFHPGAQRLRAFVHEGALGELHYLRARRHGVRSRGEGIIWDAGADPVGSILELLGDEPIEVAAHGACYRGPVVDVVSAHLRFATGIRAEVSLSSLEPDAVEDLTVIGTEGTATLDFLDRRRSLVVATDEQLAPRIADEDPLLVRCEDFVVSARSGSPERRTSRVQPAVHAVLAAVAASVDQNAAAVAPGVTGVLETVASPEREATILALPVRSA
jgi:predicted dehydrogenase